MKKLLNTNENLVIGNTSQLSHYFPEEYNKISSRDINYPLLTKRKWKRVYVCFGESRKFIDNIENFDKINYHLTLNVIEKFKDISENVLIYSTCELWNNYDGPINLNLNFDFYKTPYLNSKYKITKHVLNNEKKYSNVIVLFPFNFNSTYRSTDFLFGKIFNSIKNKNIIEIGDTYFYRDIIHPKYVGGKSINANSHEIIGSGRLIFVNDFIRDIYAHYKMNYEDYVVESIYKYNEYEKRKEYYLKSEKTLYHYNQLLMDTIEDIDKTSKNKN